MSRSPRELTRFRLKTWLPKRNRADPAVARKLGRKIDNYGETSVFWSLLGYFVMAMTFVVGFGITALIGCVLLDLMNRAREN